MDYLKVFQSHRTWITDKADPEMVNYAERFAQFLAEQERNAIEPLTTSQLRKFFGAVKTLQLKKEVSGFDESEFVMLKPKLAYAVGRVRQKKAMLQLRIESFSRVISEAIDTVLTCDNKSKAFENFINFFEAIVAYHKKYGKDKDN